MRKSRLSTHNQNRLIALFFADSTARTAVFLVGVNKNTASYYFQRLRQLIHDHSHHLEIFEGEVEADKSYFAGRRKENRVPRAGGKAPVSERVKPGSIVYTNT